MMHAPLTEGMVGRASWEEKERNTRKVIARVVLVQSFSALRSRTL